METDSSIQFMTMGDLIAAISDAAFEVLEDEDKAQEIAGMVAMRLVVASVPEAAQYLCCPRSTSIH
jgi:hypothetical protein